MSWVREGIAKGVMRTRLGWNGRSKALRIAARRYEVICTRVVQKEYHRERRRSIRLSSKGKTRWLSITANWTVIYCDNLVRSQDIPARAQDIVTTCPYSSTKAADADL